MLSFDIDSVGDCRSILSLSRLAQNLFVPSSKKVIILSGAGISVASGIPDFRSEDGLFKKLGRTYNDEISRFGYKIVGKDFFDISFMLNLHTRSFFFKFISSLKEICDDAKPSATHLFISDLYKSGNLLRWYTQNIDELEKRAGLDLVRFDMIKKDKYPVIPLHGTIYELICTICNSKIKFDDSHKKLFANGQTINCEICSKKNKDRIEAGKRSLPVGFLRPNIVLYNEMHPNGDYITNCVNEDLKRNPSIILVVGTSLKILGLKKILNQFAKTAKLNSQTSQVVYINKTPLKTKSFINIFDLELVGDCDSWVKELSKIFNSMIHSTSPNPKKDMLIRTQKSIIDYVQKRKNHEFNSKTIKK